MIVKHPSPVLLTPTERVEDFGDGLKQLVTQMFSAMEKHNGIGLAANQIGCKKRLAVLHVPGWPKMVLVNPELVKLSGEDRAEEGCLSVPGIRVFVKRPAKVVVEYQNENGQKQTLKARGLLARAIQHEVDHLDGLTCLERTAKQ